MNALTPSILCIAIYGLSQVLVFGDFPAEGTGAETGIRNDFHKVDGLNKKDFKRGYFDHLSMTGCSGLSHLGVILKVGHGNLHSKFAEMPLLGSGSSPVRCSGINSGSDEDSSKAEGPGNDGDYDLIHVVTIQVITGIVTLLGVLIGYHTVVPKKKGEA